MRARNTDFFIERRDSAAECAKSALVGLVKRAPAEILKRRSSARHSGDGADAHGRSGRIFALNRRPAGRAEPAGPRQMRAAARRRRCFALGDKVMQVKNDYDLAWTRGAARTAWACSTAISRAMSSQRRSRAPSEMSRGVRRRACVRLAACRYAGRAGTGLLHVRAQKPGQRIRLRWCCHCWRRP